MDRQDYQRWTRAEETFSSILERTSRSCPGAYEPKAGFSGFSLSQPEGWQSQLTLSCILNRILRGAFFFNALARIKEALSGGEKSSVRAPFESTNSHLQH